jgi:hypothetical protein
MTLSCVLLAGCKSSTAHQSDPAPSAQGQAATTPPAGGARAGWIAPDDSALPAGDQAVSGHAACELDMAKIRATAKNLPRATGHDVQCLADPLAVADIDHPGTVAGYRVVADPTPASRLLSSTVLSGFQADLDAFDKAAYAKAGESAPDFVVAVGTPKGSAAGLNFVGSMMTGFQATDLFAPPTVGANRPAAPAGDRLRTEPEPGPHPVRVAGDGTHRVRLGAVLRGAPAALLGGQRAR